MTEPADHLDPDSNPNFNPDFSPVEPDPRQLALLDQLLTPLLEDFSYWFERCHNLLTTEKISFLSETEQANLLNRITAAQQELAVAKTLFDLSGHRVGVDTAVIHPWHRLLVECQAIAMRHRGQSSSPS